MSFELVAAPRDSLPTAEDENNQSLKYLRRNTEEDTENAAVTDRETTRLALEQTFLNYPEQFECEERKKLFRKVVASKNEPHIGKDWEMNHRMLCRKELAARLLNVLFPETDTNVFFAEILSLLNDSAFAYDESKDGDDPETVKREIREVCEKMKTGEAIVDENGFKWIPVHLRKVALYEGPSFSYFRLYTGKKGERQSKEWYSDFKTKLSTLNSRETLLTRVLKESKDELSDHQEELRVFERLLELGADPNEPNGNGETPFYLALRLSLYEHAKALIRNSDFKFNGSSSYVSYEEQEEYVRWMPTIQENLNPIFLIFQPNIVEKHPSTEENKRSLPFWEEFFAKNNYLVLDEQVEVHNNGNLFTLLEYAFEDFEYLKSKFLDAHVAHMELIVFVVEKGKTLHGEDTADLRRWLNNFLHVIFTDYSLSSAAPLLELIGKLRTSLPDLIPTGTMTTPYQQLIQTDLMDSHVHNHHTMMTYAMTRFFEAKFFEAKVNEEQVLKTFSILKDRLEVDFNVANLDSKRPFDYLLQALKKNEGALINLTKRAKYEIATKALLFKSGINVSAAYESLTSTFDSMSGGFMFAYDLINQFGGRSPNDTERDKILNLDVPEDCKAVFTFREKVAALGS